MEIRSRWPTYVIKGSKYPQLIKRAFRRCRGQYYVYSWFRNGVALYVGYSGHIADRIKGHELINHVDKVRPTDIFFLERCNNKEHAEILEQKLIVALEPKYNSQFTQKQKLTVFGLRRAQQHVEKLCETAQDIHRHSYNSA